MPGTVASTWAMRSALRLIVARSWPVTRTPSGVRMPLTCMLMRLRIGGTQAAVRPGKASFSCSSAISFSRVIPGRHSASGLNCTVVSSMVSGAGSVALSARPALPKTVATSGTDLMMRSVRCSTASAWLGESPGRVVGMYSTSPSSSSGMNSLPRRLHGHSALSSPSDAISTMAQGRRRAKASNGR